MQYHRPFVHDELPTELAKVQWPVFYLDFEAVQTFLPLYDAVSPFEQVLTQFSVHESRSFGQIDDHFEFLADPQRDCRRELAEQLLACLGEEGSIVVYSAYERISIKTLGRLFPDLSGPLNALVDRLFDLLKVVKRTVYHPEFRGSYSIKRVLPVLVPSGLSYADLQIQDGDTAITRYARMARCEAPPTEHRSLRHDLLAYCKHDTLAMAELHRALHKLTGGQC